MQPETLSLFLWPAKLRRLKTDIECDLRKKEKESTGCLELSNFVNFLTLCLQLFYIRTDEKRLEFSCFLLNFILRFDVSTFGTDINNVAKLGIVFTLVFRDVISSKLITLSCDIIHRIPSDDSKD